MIYKHFYIYTKVMIKEFRKFRGFKILEFFLLNPTVQININELAKKLKISTMTSKQYCDLLEKEDILASKKIGNTKLFNLKDNLLTREWKKIRILQFITQNNLKKAIGNSFYLYGSFANGTYTEKSDLDIFIIKIKKIDKEKIKKIELKLKHEISINEVNYYELEEYKKNNKELINEIKEKGIFFGEDNYGF